MYPIFLYLFVVTFLPYFGFFFLDFSQNFTDLDAKYHSFSGNVRNFSMCFCQRLS